MVEVIRERNPRFEDELRREFKPFEIVEGDFTYTAVGPDMRARIIHRRQRKVRYVSADQNELRETVNDLGPATGEDSYVVPCSDAVEMAQALELIDWQKRKTAELAARRAMVAPIRDAEWKRFLVDFDEENRKKIRGLTTVGPYQRIQREGV